MQSSTPVVPGLEPYELKIGGPENNQPQFHTLHALRSPDGRVISRWELTQEEREAIAAGADVFLHVYCAGQPYPPTLLEVQRPDDAYAEAVKRDMSLEDELTLRLLHQDMMEKQRLFNEKVQEIQQREQRAAQLRESLGGGSLQ